ncbi:hypothetical protein [Sporomusa malonica]
MNFGVAFSFVLLVLSLYGQGVDRPCRFGTHPILRCRVE